MRKLFVLVILIGTLSSVLNAQTDVDTIKNLQNSIRSIEAITSKLTSQVNAANAIIRKHERQISYSADTIKILQDKLSQTNSKLIELSNSLGTQIQESSNKASTQITSLSYTVSKNTTYWIIAVSLAVLLSGLLFFLMRSKMTKDKTGLSDQIKETTNALRGELVKLDDQLVKVLDSQLKLMQNEQRNSLTRSEEVDHTLALKIADEIIRINKNLSNMDPGIKGLKQLSSSVDRIQDNFKANGYEMVDMLDKPYDQGMKVSANFRPDENLKPGEQKITRIIKPQVNYKGVMIQAAQVEVSIGE